MRTAQWNHPSETSPVTWDESRAAYDRLRERGVIPRDFFPLPPYDPSKLASTLISVMLDDESEENAYDAYLVALWMTGYHTIIPRDVWSEYEEAGVLWKGFKVV